MRNTRQLPRLGPFGLSALMAVTPLAQAAPASDGEAQAAQRLEVLKRQVDQQTRKLEQLRRSVTEQQASLDEVRRALGVVELDALRGGTASVAGQPTPETQRVAQTAATPVGAAPERNDRPPAVAPIFDQPGVLTPKGKFVLEPSIQYSYSSSNRVALVGYTIIPAILIGLVDVREVKRNTLTGTLTARYGLTNRFEVEGRLPYVYRHDNSVGRQIGSGASTDSVFTASGHDIGDVEFTARYQFNNGGLEKPYYIGSLRLKTRTGTDPFEVTTTTSVQGLGSGLQLELPTGSGFVGLQPALTVLYPSDPAVFFGSLSYLYSFKRNDVSLITDTGPQPLGTVQPGGVFGFNFGMGLGLNEKSSFSIGYDHSAVGKTKLDGRYLSDSVWVQLGTLLLGYSYRMNSTQSFNLSLGVGVTRDTPDVTLTLRMPISF